MNLDVVASFLSKSAFKATGTTVIFVFFVYFISYPTLNGTSYATEDFVHNAIDCRNAPDSIRIIKMRIWDLKEEVTASPKSNELRDELKEEEEELKRKKEVLHSPECNR